MSRFKYLSILVCIALSLGIAYLMVGRMGAATVNGKQVRGIEFSGEAGKKYLEQYYNDTHTFCYEDRLLNEKFVRTTFSSKDEPSTIEFLLGKFKKRKYNVVVFHNPNIKGIKAYLKKYNKTATSSIEPKVVYTDGRYKAVAGTVGTKIDIKGVLDAIKADKTGIALADFVVKPKNNDKTATALALELNELLDWHIDYTSGQQVKINPVDIHVDKSNLTYTLTDTTDYRPLLRELDEKYGVVNKETKVRLHNGKEAIVKGGTWGRLTNSAKELEFIKSSRKNLRSYDNRKPVMHSGKPKGLIVEVSIPAQHVWVYNSNKVVMDSPCVTGTKGSHDTPTGVFKVSEMRKDYVMHGENADGSKYESHCQRFMRLTNRGVALHDAPWRGVFGGSIYKYSGSHGCVNLPPAFALKLFDKIDNGTMVIVH